MAVPKKRVSRTRKLLRRSQWKLEIRAQALQALSLASSQTAKKAKTPEETPEPGI
jgi:ribosomal protein L32